jgi:cytochrome c-type biogenesis protein CcmH/NrfG
MAIQAHPSYAIAWENLGDLYVKMAAQSYEKAAQLDPKSRTAGSKLTLARDMLRVQGKPGTK